MAKDERFESRLSAEGRTALERLAAHFRISKAAVIEMIIADTERRTFSDGLKAGRTPVRITARSKPDMIIVADPTEEDDRALRDIGYERGSELIKVGESPVDVLAGLDKDGPRPQYNPNAEFKQWKREIEPAGQLGPEVERGRARPEAEQQAPFCRMCGSTESGHVCLLSMVNPELEQQAKDERKARKEARANRKTDMQETVSKALGVAFRGSFPKPGKK